MNYTFTPLNLNVWVEKNKHLLVPPVCNKLIFEEKEAFIIVIGGANERQEFHYNEAPEFFYQIKGDMLLKVRTSNKIRDVHIREGDIFLLPPCVPHSPVRFKDTVGLVVDIRHSFKKDGLLWFCPECDSLIHEEYLKVKDIEKDFIPVYEKFYSHKDFYTCKKCNFEMIRN